MQCSTLLNDNRLPQLPTMKNGMTNFYLLAYEFVGTRLCQYVVESWHGAETLLQPATPNLTFLGDCEKQGRCFRAYK